MVDGGCLSINRGLFSRDLKYPGADYNYVSNHQIYQEQKSGSERVTLTELRLQAIDLHKQNKFAEASNAYQLYLAQSPKDAGIWTNLGAALRATKQYVAAIGCYRRALDLNPADAGIMSNLGNVLKDIDRVEEAVHYQANAVELEPDNRQYRLNFAVALREAKQFDKALHHINVLLSMDAGNATYQWERSLNHLYLGNFKEGWIDYEARWRTGDLKLPGLPEMAGCPKWQGESLKDKKILLMAEQGYGDTILAARFIPHLRDLGITHLAFECKPELQPIFSQLPIDEYISPQQARYEKNQFDYYCPLMSLMGVLGVDLTNIPQPVPITIPEASREKFQFIKSQYDEKLKIGIVWSGSLTFKDNDKRACSLEKFLQLAELPNVQLFSLQKGEREKDLDRMQAMPLVINLSKQLDTFGDTAAAVNAMDLIVMTDSSVAHLAGSLCKPIVNLQQYKPYWLYYPENETTPWYPSMRIIQQQKAGDWDGVFVQLKKLLASE